ncbi:hypothetical protein LPJ66_006982, partial [Kickxella alabastrina]
MASEVSTATVIVEMDEPYVQGIIQAAFSKYGRLIKAQTAAEYTPSTSTLGTRLMHWREYENIDWDTVHRSTTT